MLTWLTRLEGDGLSGGCLAGFEQDLGQSDLESQGMAGRKETKNITERKNRKEEPFLLKRENLTRGSSISISLGS